MSQGTKPADIAEGSIADRRSGHRRRRRRLVAPPRALALSGWALLPLRAFLGFTFCFAGLQKLANPNFFNANSPSSIQAQLTASTRISPLHPLLAHLLPYAVAIGVVIALGELAVGIGTLLGLWTRVAAVGGMVLALTLFLTVSFHSSPYYTGADIVFFFAWIPLVLAGSGGVLSLDALIADRLAGEHDLGPQALVAVPFALVQRVCGHYENDTCRAQSGRPCDVVDCPFLSAGPSTRSGNTLQERSGEIDRRTVVLSGTVAAAAAVAGGVVAGAAAGLGRAAGGAKSPDAQTVKLSPTLSRSPPSSAKTPVPGSATLPSTTQPTGKPIGPASQVPVGGSAAFTDPNTGDPGLVIQIAQGQFVAYDAVCPHAGCTVGYSPAAKLIVCPCHGSEFDPRTGAVVRPPAPHGLSPIPLAEAANGELVVED